jgi:hypothetical protein
VKATAGLFVQGIGVASIFFEVRIETSLSKASPFTAFIEASSAFSLRPNGGAFFVKWAT